MLGFSAVGQLPLGQPESRTKFFLTALDVANFVFDGNIGLFENLINAINLDPGSFSFDVADGAFTNLLPGASYELGSGAFSAGIQGFPLDDGVFIYNGNQFEFKNYKPASGAFEYGGGSLLGQRVSTIQFSTGQFRLVPAETDFVFSQGFGLQTGSFSLTGNEYYFVRFQLDAGQLEIIANPIYATNQYLYELNAGQFSYTGNPPWLRLTRLFNPGAYVFDAQALGTISVDATPLDAFWFALRAGLFEAINSVTLDHAGYIYSAANAQFRKGPAQTGPVRGLHVSTINALHGSRVPRRLYPGQTLRLAVRFKTETGVDVDPAQVVLETRSPTGIKKKYTYRIDTNIDQLNIGDYRCALVVDEPGEWHYRWEGTDEIGNIAVVEDVANVMSSEFRLPRYEFRDYWR